MACPVLGTLSDLSIASGRFCAVSFCCALSNERVRFMTYFLKPSRSFPPSTAQSRGRSANKWDWMFFGWVGILRLLGWQQTNLRVLQSGWRKVSMFVACILHQLSMLCQYVCAFLRFNKTTATGVKTIWLIFFMREWWFYFISGLLDKQAEIYM